MRCCICGSGIAGSNRTVLFPGAQAEKNVICSDCQEKLNALLRGENVVNYCKFFLEKAEWGIAEGPVGNYLQAVLRHDGYVDVERIRQNLRTVNREATVGIKVQKSGWVALLRFVAWVEVIGGCLASLIFGIVLGQGSGALGVAITLIGTIISFFLSAAVMVFLDMASDIHAIRQYVKKQLVEQR